LNILIDKKIKKEFLVPFEILNKEEMVQRKRLFSCIASRNRGDRGEKKGDGMKKEIRKETLLCW